MNQYDVQIQRILIRSAMLAIVTFAIGALLYATLGITDLSAILFVVGAGIAANIIRV